MLITSDCDNVGIVKKKSIIHIPKVRIAQYLYVFDVCYS